jgi:excinuclease ABC subunit B
MGIALYHEAAPHRAGEGRRGGPRKPNLDEMGPGVESVPGKRDPSGPRSTLGRPGMRGGWKPRRR